MENILEIRNLSKTYQGFHLDNVHFSLPKGCIMGLIGENGAGKSTIIKLILNLICRDSGEVKIFGKDNIEKEKEIKEALGVVLDESNFPEHMKAPFISRVMGNIYKDWDDALFVKYLERFNIPLDKQIKEYSKGMKMKFSIAVALSHGAKLLILDEATSGLDPIIRDEMLDIFLEFIQNEEHSILFSSHIMSDLEKIADYVTVIHKGKFLFSEAKDHLLYEYGILKCSHDEFEKINKDVIIGHRKNQFGVEALVSRKNMDKNLMIDPAGLEDILLFHIRGEDK